MHAAAFSPRGGARRASNLRGQGLIEYVLIIAIIGLVIVFAGPGVAGVIRNQFNQVTNTVDSGNDGDNFISAEEKAYREAMKTVAQKEAKDWTLDEQKAAATDIAKKGTSSVVYAKAKAAMDAGTKFSVKLTNGQTMRYRIIGINHDDSADGSGKAGLTFLTTSTDIRSRMNATETNVGGWEKSELRSKMNSGEIWNLMPSEFQSKVKTVRKLTNNVDGKIGDSTVTVTDDKLFLLSYSEIVETPKTEWYGKKYLWIGGEGSQYDAFKDSPVSATGDQWWERTAYPDSNWGFLAINSSGQPAYSSGASNTKYIRSAFCF